MNARSSSFGLQRALGVRRDVVGVFVEVGVDQIDRLVLGLVERLALLVVEAGRHHLAAAVERGRHDVRALLQGEADERLHHGDGAIGAVFQAVPAHLRQPAVDQLDVLGPIALSSICTVV